MPILSKIKKKNERSKMSTRKQGIMIGVIGTILCGLCLAALPYGADLACVYVRQMDTRDPVYNRVIMPSKEFVTQYGGLTERNVIFFNLSAMPEIVSELNKLRADVDALKKLSAPIDPNVVVPDANSVK